MKHDTYVTDKMIKCCALNGTLILVILASSYKIAKVGDINYKYSLIKPSVNSGHHQQSVLVIVHLNLCSSYVKVLNLVHH